MDSSAHRRTRHERTDRPLSATERADFRWGLERVLLRHEGDGAGAGAGHDLARALQRALRHLPVVMLHDRMLPGGLVAEHVAVGPGGVTVIAAWSAADAPAPLTVERLRGIFGARAELLRDGACADRTALVGPIRRLVTVIRTVIDEMAPVQGALCLDGEEPATRLRPLQVEGITVGDAKAIAELAARDGDLHDYELTALVELLDAALPPTL
jgi:hypothetical protein